MTVEFIGTPALLVPSSAISRWLLHFKLKSRDCRSYFNAFLVTFVAASTLILYLAVYLPYCRRIDVDWMEYRPNVIYAATALGVVATFSYVCSLVRFFIVCCWLSCLHTASVAVLLDSAAFSCFCVFQVHGSVVACVGLPNPSDSVHFISWWDDGVTLLAHVLVLPFCLTYQ